jgi:hypothetical protein
VLLSVGVVAAVAAFVVYRGRGQSGLKKHLLSGDMNTDREPRTVNRL